MSNLHLKYQKIVPLYMLTFL